MFGKILVIKKNEKIKSILFYILLIISISFLYAYTDAFINSDKSSLKLLNKAFIFSFIFNIIMLIFGYFESKYISKNKNEPPV